MVGWIVIGRVVVGLETENVIDTHLHALNDEITTTLGEGAEVRNTAGRSTSERRTGTAEANADHELLRQQRRQRLEQLHFSSSQEMPS